MNLKAIRWEQRFENLQKAFNQLEANIKIKNLRDIEKQGLIKSFEFTFELCWKTLKDYLESEGIIAKTPREIIKQAFHIEIIADGETWIDMLEQRNLMAHTYDEERANKAIELIKHSYFHPIKNLVLFFKTKI